MKNLKLILAIMFVGFVTNMSLLSQTSATISFLEQPKDMIGCYNEINRVIGVVAANENTTNTLSFQWFKDGKALTSGVESPFEANKAGYGFGALQHSQAGVYECLVWDEQVMINNGWGGMVQLYIDWGENIHNIYNWFLSGFGAQITRATTVQVINTPNITRQPMSAQADAGETIYMDVEGTLYGELPPSYKTMVQWYNGANMIVDNADFEGAQSSYLTVRNAEKYYNANIWCKLTGYCGSVNSATVTITPKPGVDITADLTGDVTTCVGETTTFTIGAVATNGGNNANIMYQWYTAGAAVASATMNTYEFTATAGVTSDIYCMVTYGTDGNSKISTKVSVTGNEAPMFSATISDQEVDEGDDLVLVATASGVDNTYAWYMASSTVSIGSGSSLTLTAVDESDSGLYYCVATNACGSDQSNSASITVKSSGIVMSVDNATKFELNVSPNPSQGLSNVTFNLATAQNVTVVLNNATGLEIATLANGYLPKGFNSFEVNAHKFNLSSGVYYITMITENGIATRKLVYIK